MTNTSIPINERFERLVIFRLARWLPLGMGGLAVLTLITCIALLAYSFSPSTEPSKPQPISAPSPISLTLEDLKTPVVAKKSVSENADETHAAASTETAVDTTKEKPNSSALALIAELGKLRELLIARGIAFTDIKSTQCTSSSPYDGTCYQTEEVLEQKGVANDILAVLSLYDDDGEATNETFPVPNSDLTINLRLDSTLDTKTNIIKELVMLLEKVNAKETDKYLNAWIRIRTERESAQRASQKEEFANQTQKYDEAVNEHAATVLKKKAMQWTSFLGLLAALGVLVFSALVLAVIAIERHSRSIQTLIEKIQHPEHKDQMRTTNIEAPFSSQLD